MEKKGVNKCVIEYVGQIAKLINEGNVIIAPGQVSILSDKFCGEKAFPYLLPMDKN